MSSNASSSAPLLGLAKRFGAELTLLHVMLPIHWEYGSTYLPLDIDQDHERLHQDLAKQLEQFSSPDKSSCWKLRKGKISTVDLLIAYKPYPTRTPLVLLIGARGR